jgi:hypothetical protein
MQSKVKRKVTLSIDEDLYVKFQDYCEKNAIMISRKIEIWMEEFLKKNRD